MGSCYPIQYIIKINEKKWNNKSWWFESYDDFVRISYNIESVGIDKYPLLR